MIFSLVVPTLHRTAEVNQLLRSIAGQKIKGVDLKKDVEVIVVDQNPDERLADILGSYGESLTIRRVQSPAMGLSHAKNVGLKSVRGKYVAFPDDDCFYAPETLERVYRAFGESGAGTALFGRSLEKESGRYLLRYPEKELTISTPDSPEVFLGLQIAQFYPADKAERVGGFDLRFGIGGRWGSGEETDFAIRFLKAGGRIQYRPEILVYHPLVVPDTMPLEKVRRYAAGFGALCRKQGLFRLLAVKAVKQMAGALFYLATARPRKAVVAWNVALFRLKGYLQY